MSTKLAENTPTPETDVAQLLHFDEPVVPIHFARQLERERNFYKQANESMAHKSESIIKLMIERDCYREIIQQQLAGIHKLE